MNNSPNTNNHNNNNKGFKNNRSKKSQNQKAPSSTNSTVNTHNNHSNNGRHQRSHNSSKAKANNNLNETKTSSQSTPVIASTADSFRPNTNLNVDTFKMNRVVEKQANIDEIKNRYWKYLFDNLERSINEIYQTCEIDNEISKCKILSHQSFEKTAINETSTKLNSGWPFQADTESLSHQTNKVIPHLESVLNNSSKIENSRPQEQRKIIELNNSYDSYKSQDPLSTTLVTGFQDFLPINQLVYNEENVGPKDSGLLGYSSRKKKSCLVDDDGYDECDESDDTETIFSYDNASKNEEQQNSLTTDIDLYNSDTFDSNNIHSISDNILDYSFQTKQFESQLQQQQQQQQQNQIDYSAQLETTTPLLTTPLYSFGNNYQKRIQTQQLPTDLLTRISFPLQTVGLTPFSTFPSILNPFTNWRNSSTNYYTNFEQNLTDFNVFNSYNFDTSTSNIISSLTMVEPLNLNNFLPDLNVYKIDANQSGCELPIFSPNTNQKAVMDTAQMAPATPEILTAESINSLYKQSQHKKSNDYEDYLSYEDTETADENESNFLKVSNNYSFNCNVKKWDNIDQVMLKAYEEEEDLVNEIEKVQNKELLSVMAQEAKLAKQLSFEKQFFLSGVPHSQKYNQNYLNETETEDQLTSQRSSYNEKALYVDRESENDEVESEVDTTQRGAGGSKLKTLQIHEKMLMSLNRKPSPNERRRRHEEKQAKAQAKREQFYQNRSKKLRELTKKIEEVRDLKKRLLKVKKITMKAKLQRAEEKRQYLLRLKANKAAVEEQKAHEIAFINNLVAQNRRHDILEKYERRHEAIRQNIEEERLRKQEEQKAKEQAAELRRKELEIQRNHKLKQMCERRRIKQTKIEQSLLDKEKERVELAKAKERTREIRLATIEAQFQANKQKIRKEILKKQEESTKRHESQLDDIRKKALEMSILHFSTDDSFLDTTAPTPVPYERAKFCLHCSVVIKSEVQLKSHLRGIKHQQMMNTMNQGKTLTRSEIEEFNLKCIVDANVNEDEEIQLSSISLERNKLLKKRIKKLKSRLVNKGIEYENKRTIKATNSKKTVSKVPKLLKAMESFLTTNTFMDKISNLDRIAGELNRAIAKSPEELDIFRAHDGHLTCVKLIEQIFNLISSLNNSASIYKLTLNLVTLLDYCCSNNYELLCDFVLGNKVIAVLELLNVFSGSMFAESMVKSNQKPGMVDDIILWSSFIQLFTSLFTRIDKKSGDDLMRRTSDILSLLISFDLIDIISQFFDEIQGPLDESSQTIQVLENCLYFLIAITKFLVIKSTPYYVFSEHRQSASSGENNSQQLVSTFKETNLVNIISMLYGMLHKETSTPIKYHANGSAAQTRKQQAVSTLKLSTLSLKLLNQMITLDLGVMQSLLGDESNSLQLRHISSYLIWYLTTNRHDELLHEIVLLIGYFSVLNNENQLNMELGTPPTILQQLCNLPFNYFSDTKLICVLYPTLICYCYDNEKNKSVLATEVSTNLLTHFIEEKINEEKNAPADKNSLKSDKYDLDKRFPRRLWQQACDYFRSTNEYSD